MTPWHPAIVHYPVAFAVLSPLMAFAVLMAMRWGALPSRAWIAVVALLGIVCGTALLAVETGENDRARVQEHVPEQALVLHETWAERFYLASWVVLALSALGLIAGRARAALRIGTLIGACVLALLAVRVGQAGGELVYRHGAAEVHRAR